MKRVLKTILCFVLAISLCVPMVIKKADDNDCYAFAFVDDAIYIVLFLAAAAGAGITIQNSDTTTLRVMYNEFLDSSQENVQLLHNALKDVLANAKDSLTNLTMPKLDFSIASNQKLVAAIGEFFANKLQELSNKTIDDSGTITANISDVVTVDNTDIANVFNDDGTIDFFDDGEKTGFTQALNYFNLLTSGSISNSSFATAKANWESHNYTNFLTFVEFRRLGTTENYSLKVYMYPITNTNLTSLDFIDMGTVRKLDFSTQTSQETLAFTLTCIYTSEISYYITSNTLYSNYTVLDTTFWDYSDSLTDNYLGQEYSSYLIHSTLPVNNLVDFDSNGYRINSIDLRDTKWTTINCFDKFFGSSHLAYDPDKLSTIPDVVTPPSEQLAKGTISVPSDVIVTADDVRLPELDDIYLPKITDDNLNHASDVVTNAENDGLINADDYKTNTDIVTPELVIPGTDYLEQTGDLTDTNVDTKTDTAEDAKDSVIVDTKTDTTTSDIVDGEIDIPNALKVLVVPWHYLFELIKQAFVYLVFFFACFALLPYGIKLLIWGSMLIAIIIGLINAFLGR